jgi:hypothetical protein
LATVQITEWWPIINFEVLPGQVCGPAAFEKPLVPIAVSTATAAATTAATPTAVSTATAAAALRPLLTRTRFVDSQGTTLKVFLVEHSDCFCGIVLRAHLDEGKPSRTAGGTILHDVDGDHRSSLREVVLQVVFSCAEG